MEYYEIERIWYSKAANNAVLELQELKWTHKYNHMYPFLLHSLYVDTESCEYLKFCILSLQIHLNIVIKCFF